MKAKFVRGDQWVAADVGGITDAELESMSTVVDGHRCWNEGAVIDHPQAYLLVRNGVAEPADEECKKRAGMSSDQMKVSQEKFQDMLNRIEDERAEVNEEDDDE